MQTQERAGMVGPAATERPYVEQLARGTRELRFAGSLEGEFRDDFRRFAPVPVRIAFGAAAVLCALSAFLYALAPGATPESLRAPLALSAIALLVLLLAGFGISMADRDGRASRAAFLGGILLVTVLLAVLRVVHARAGMAVPYPVEGVLAVAVFLLSGQRFENALAIAVTVVAAMVFTYVGIGAPPADLASGALAFLFAATFAGAGAFVLEIVARTNFLNRRIAEYRAHHDPLTGLLNRSGLDEFLPRIWRQAYRERKPVAIMIADVDRFTAYNDAFGQLEGDRTLNAFAGMLQREAVRRPMDFAARVGGERYACGWYDVSPQVAERLAEAFRAAVEERGSEHRDSPAGRLTVSCGCAASVPESPSTHEELFAMAESALATAKSAGRNRVVMRRRPNGTDPVPPDAGWATRLKSA